MTRQLTLAVTFLLFGIRVLSAQQDSARGLQTLRNLSATTLYRVQTGNKSILLGRFADSARDTIVLTPASNPRGRTPIAVRDIISIRYRNGNQGAKGFLLGTGIGVALGLVLGSGIEAGDIGSPGTYMATLLGSVGAITGLIAGMNTDRWSRVPWP